MPRAPREPPPSPVPEPPPLVTLRCTAAEAALVVRVLRATPPGDEQARRLADVLAEETVLQRTPTRPR